MLDNRSEGIWTTDPMLKNSNTTAPLTSIPKILQITNIKLKAIQTYANNPFNKYLSINTI